MELFGNSSIRTYIEAILNLKWVEDLKLMPVIDFGFTLDDVENLIVLELLKNS